MNAAGVAAWPRQLKLRGHGSCGSVATAVLAAWPRQFWRRGHGSCGGPMTAWFEHCHVAYFGVRVQVDAAVVRGTAVPTPKPSPKPSILNPDPPKIFCRA
eukprot:352361-Chlamydomonas_euryale.AAC.11